MNSYSLQLFEILLGKKALGLSESVILDARRRFEELKKKQDVAQEEVERAMIDFGKRAWVFWQAVDAFEGKYGKEKERELFLSGLSGELKAKWLDYVGEVGEEEAFSQGKKFEDAFTPEENLEIERSLLKAKEEVEKYVVGLIEGEKKDEYDALVEEFKNEQLEIEGKLEELRKLKELGEKWDDEIDMEILFFEKGFAEIEKRPRVEDVVGKVEFYRGKIL